MEEQMKKVELSKKDVVRSFWRWTFFSHANYNYERLAGTGFCHAMAPIIEKLYKDNPEEYKAAVQRHMVFYNTEPHFGGVINGMVIAMEEERANGAEISDEAINGIKTGLMGPFAGIGDTLWQGTLTPILLSIGISLASNGSLAGPIVYTILMMGIMLGLAYFVWMRGYTAGKEGLQKILESKSGEGTETQPSGSEADRDGQRAGQNPGHTAGTSENSGTGVTGLWEKAKGAFGSAKETVTGAGKRDIIFRRTAAED